MDPELLRTLTPAAVKIYFAAIEPLSRRGSPFSASAVQIRQLTGLSDPTISDARRELIARGVIVEARPPGHYAVGPKVLEHLKELKGSGRGRPPQVNVGDGFRGRAQNPSDLKGFSSPEGRPTPLPPLAGLSPRVQKRLKRGAGLPSGEEKHFKGQASWAARRAHEVAGTTLEDRRAAVHSACKILGSTTSGGYVTMAMQKLAALLKGGATIDDALEVARYARSEFDRGDRFKRLLNLVYIWRASEFTPLQAAMRSPAKQQREYSTISDPVERDAFRESFARRARERQP